MEKLRTNEYQCAYCGKVYEKGWSDEEAHAEAARIFGKPPEEWNDGQAIICDGCFQKINPEDHPEQLENAKRFI